MIQAIAAAWRFERQIRAVDRAIPMLPWPRDPLRHQLAVDFAMIDAETRNGLYIGRDGHWHTQGEKKIA